MKNKNLFLQVLIRILKKSKLRTLLLLIIFFSFNTAAWFIYATKIDVGIGARIAAWDISFITGEEEIVQNIRFNVPNIYPGMDTYYKTLSITNRGEANAIVSYEIKSVRILDNVYTVNDEVTSELLNQSLRTDYPFKITIGVSDYEIVPTAAAEFYFSVIWEYESGNDELDTFWGMQAYDFNSLNPDEDSIEINLSVKAIQNKIN